jgi:hypothetical protein
MEGRRMDFYEVLAQVIDVLKREGRTSYRALKRQFDIDDAYLHYQTLFQRGGFHLTY